MNPGSPLQNASPAVGGGSPTRPAAAVTLRFGPVLALLTVNLLAIAAAAFWAAAPHFRWVPLPKLLTKSAAANPRASGPWGVIERRRIVVSAPLEFIDRFARVEPTIWVFPNHTEEKVFEVFRRFGFTENQIKLAGAQRWSRSPAGIIIEVADELVWQLSPATRAKFYNYLAVFPVNAKCRFAPMQEEATWEELLGAEWISRDTAALFRRLLYARGNKLVLTDGSVLLRRLASPEEQERATQILSSSESLLVRLIVPPGENVNALVDYWGRGGRAKDLRPLLESLARVPGGADVDVAHLLPPFARRRLYTFPFASFDGKYSAQDCHWTSLNFFNEEPDDRFSDPAFCEQVIRRDYELVTGAPRFGDLVAIIDPREQLMHSAIYLADNLVFTKNGSLLNAPWILMELPTMLDTYRATYNVGEGFQARYFRLKAL